MRKISLNEQIVFFSQMADMLKAGVPLVKSIELIGESVNSRNMKDFSKDLSKFIVDGGKLSDGFSRYSGINDEYILNMIKIGEQGGFIDEKFREIAIFLEKIRSIKMKLIYNLIYPVILLHAGILLPPLFNLFTGNVKVYFQCTLSVLIPLYLTVLAIAVFFPIFSEIQLIRNVFDSFLVNIPLIKGLVKKLSVARFTRAFGGLYEAGVPLSQSILISSRACGNVIIGGKFANMSKAVDAGMPIEQVMAATGLFSPISIQFISTGKDTGDLGRMLLKAADVLDGELDETIKRFTLIFPIFIYLIIGIYVGYTVINTFLGIYKGILF